MSNNIANISDILNTDYADYGRYVVSERAIPHFWDGLKPVQRKILACAIKNCQTKTLKIASLTGKVMGDFGYHHGDSSCNGAAIVMNQEFMQGMPYLDKDGQFGWLYEPVAGAARYIGTTLSGWSKLLLHDDAELIPQYNDDGDQIEPEFYLPILPMLLINGTDGIAVGYSTSFVNRNPLEVALATREYVATGKLKDYTLTPFVNGHLGAWSYFRGRYEHVAGWHRKSDTLLSIDALPINTTIPKFKAKLNQLIDAGLIIKFDEVSRPGHVEFDIHMSKEPLDNLVADNGVPHFFGLIYRLPKDNLTCIMPDKSIKRFESPIAFIKEFVDYRLAFYKKRKRRIIRDITKRIKYLDDLIKFIMLVLDGKLTIKGKTRRELEHELKDLGIDKSVLLVQVFQLTRDNLGKHVEEVKALIKELESIKNTTEKDMYLTDLDNLLPHVRKFYAIEDVININKERLLRIQ